jgi:hypothetical protein
MSMPAQNPRPSARRTTTRTSSSRPSFSKLEASSNQCATLGALTGGTSITTSGVLPGRVTAVHDEVGAGAVRALVGGEEDHHLRYLLGAADARYGVGLVHLLELLFGLPEGVGHLRVDAPRAHGVDPDPPASQLDGRGLRHAAHGELRGRVADDARHALEPGRGSRVHDRSAARLTHRADHGPHAEEASHLVHADDGQVVVERVLVQGCPFQDPGVVDQYVHHPERSEGRAHALIPGGFLGDVVMHVTSGLADLLGYGLALLEDVRQHHPRPLGGEPARDRGPLAAGGARDYRNLAVQPSQTSSLLGWRNDI